MKTSAKIRTFASFLLFCSFGFLSFPLIVDAQYFRGYLQNPPGSADCNPCVVNVVQAVNTLRDRGETMGFNWGANYPPVEGSGTDSHWQGIQRMPILPSAELNLPYMVVSSSHGGQPNPFSRFALVEMSSRDRDGLRLRSNRLERGRLTKDVPPHASDRIVVSKVIRTDYDHPGGMQAIGKYLLVGSETDKVPSPGYSILSLFDMSNPQAQSVWELRVDKDAASAMGIVRLEDGRYLLLRALGGTTDLEFYVKKSSDIRENNWDLWDAWNYTELRSELRNSDGSLDLNWRLICFFKDAGYQNINIVAECGTGTLYLIASHGRCPDGTGGDDFVDAYRLEIPTSPGDVIITKAAKRHMFPGDNADDRQGDLQAGAGLYISPDNKLYFYATEHGRNGPGSSVKMIEFGPEEPRSQANSIEDAWVELYDDKKYDGRSIILDFVDRNLRDYNNFDAIEKFDNIPSSVIYSIPVGYRLRLYEHENQGGGFLDLNGTGHSERIVDLESLNLSNGVNASEISSALWNGGQFAEAWVDFNHQGTQDGSFDSPYNTLVAGLAGVLSGGVVKFKSSSSRETMIINKPVLLEAYDGTAVIGKQ